MMTYQEAQDYLNSFVNYEEITNYSYENDFRIERIQALLQLLGNPQDTLRVIHVAGTKGKGSTCIFIAHILQQAGFTTGLYTSPHLYSVRERIRILDPADNAAQGVEHNGCFFGMISEADVCACIEKLKPAVERCAKESPWGALTFFEVYTTLAFLYFKEKQVDFAVLETGLGGRLDATNTAQALVSVITPVSYEHTQYLGATLEEIAREKAGIIKHRNQAVVVAPQQESVAQEIRLRCERIGARCTFVNNDITCKEVESNSEHQFFNCASPQKTYNKLKIKLLGKHQLINAACSIGAIERLRQHSIDIPEESIKRGLDNACWPGRFEIVKRSPTIVLDGAQNAASAEALRETLIRQFGNKKVILVLGVSSDKDIKGIAKALASSAKTIILTKANHPRAMSLEIMGKYFNPSLAHSTETVKDAMNKAQQLVGNDDVIAVTGSLFVVAEARELCLS
ncbi:bifunctional folylpolyglutamate synthase/dihydrofolate synthase [Candidatus Omnitrophota bacterium]